MALYTNVHYDMLSSTITGNIKPVVHINQTRPTHRRTDANLYQLTKASEPSFDLEGGAKGQI